VNLAHAQSIRKLPGGRQTIELAGALEIPVSRRRAPEVVSALSRISGTGAGG
jgi:DNA-binding LytR/AlgR family response regulator